MKICWNNLEGVYLSKKGDLIKSGVIYIEKDFCKFCGESYLTEKRRPSKFCSKSCANSKENNPLYGKTSKSVSESNSKRIGVLNFNYKDGIHKLGLASYSTYGNRLSKYEDVRKQKDLDVLETKCVYCGKWFAPTRHNVKSRLIAINNIGGRHLYCSDECKDNCPTYRQYKYPKGFKKGTSREVSTYLRKLCFERDNWECQKCEAITNLHCHHINGYAQNKILANDIDNVITLCKNCHKEIHSKIGCRYADLKCKPIKNKKE